jgi:hypothetical protein
MSTTAAYKKAKDQIAAARKQMKATAKEVIKEATAEVFVKNPELVSFGWTQYTPYWNDGDVCEFSANTEYPSVIFKAGDKLIKGGDYSIVQIETVDDVEGIEFSIDGGHESEEYKALNKISEKLSKAVYAALKGFDDEDMENAFGDHVQVTVNRNGKIATEEYEHE